MKTNKLIIAAAGSGKTTFLVREALREKNDNILITTYTLANEAEIRKKFIELNGCVPTNVTVQTWFSALLQHGVRPYQGGLFDQVISGMLLVNGRSGVKYTNKSNKKVYYGESEDLAKYYFTKEFKIFSDKISKFVFRCNELSDGAIIDRLSRIYSHIFIDEIQDLAGYDLELLKLLMMSPSSILFVGDPRQVTYLTHHSTKYGKYKDGRIKEFIQTECRKIACKIDEETLNRSHRNNKLICDYSSKLFPGLKSCLSNQNDTTEHDGIFLIREQDVEQYLQKYNPVQLRESVLVKSNNNFKSLNFGISKGLTFDRVLIYPTQEHIKWLKNNDHKLPSESRSKLYVAITRAKYSVGIIYNYKEGTEFAGIQKFISN